MKWRIELSRKDSASKPGQAGRRIGVEVIARDITDAASRAMQEAKRMGYGPNLFNFSVPRKI